MIKSLNEIEKEKKEFIQNMNNEQYGLLISTTWTSLLNCAISEHDNKKFRQIENRLYTFINIATDEQKRYLNQGRIIDITYNKLLKVYEDSFNKSKLLNFSLILTFFCADVDSLLEISSLISKAPKLKENKRTKEHINIKIKSLQLTYDIIKEHPELMDLAKNFLDKGHYNYILNSLSDFEHFIKTNSLFKESKYYKEC